MSLKRAHELLKISRSQSDERVCVSKLQIQTAFRSAALLHHPDLRRGSRSVGVSAESSAASSELFRECSEARELLLDYYVRHKFVPKNVVESTRNVPHDDTLFSVWTTNRSFQLEVFLSVVILLVDGELILLLWYHGGIDSWEARQPANRDTYHDMQQSLSNGISRQGQSKEIPSRTMQRGQGQGKGQSKGILT
ncbi:hypothetical protein THAOC_33370 [Thalassiosira oceanica]|uniref:J domain-containing protein n=1 Tax=Thalassiosira oceanica TaxID=159749 RepID=K0RMC3_THAOC|nr:hypothetical protein THAOC_33370 [Thalassiosira oceanica]|eukprot:EJK47882.1 hypothetical protein THAOC_33370 [Thalassiosira oceanica]